MNFGLAINLSVEIKNKRNIIQLMSDELHIYFEKKSYGTGIKTCTIGIICISPQFEPFYKERKPKYSKGLKIISPDGIPITLEDNFEYSIKLNFETFKNANEDEIKKVLAKEILASLIVFEKMRSKIKDFDTHHFKTDLEDYFKNNN